MAQDPPDPAFPKIRDKDAAILQLVADGEHTTRNLRETTTLSRREIQYAFDKLEDLTMLTVEAPDGYTTEMIDGQQRRFRKPKRAALTDRGIEYLQWADEEDAAARFREADWNELTQQVKENTALIEAIDGRLEQFRQQMVQELEQARDTDRDPH
jgi:hypothetical protein